MARHLTQRETRRGPSLAGYVPTLKGDSIFGTKKKDLSRSSSSSSWPVTWKTAVVVVVM